MTKTRTKKPTKVRVAEQFLRRVDLLARDVQAVLRLRDRLIRECERQGDSETKGQSHE